MPQNAKGIALLSGSGGTGRTSMALNLASYLAGKGEKVLLFDMCFGWSGLNSLAGDLLSYDELLKLDDEVGRAVCGCNGGFDLLTCEPPEFLEPSEDDLKKIAFLANRLAQNYDCLIFDPPAGGHPLALLAAGLSERVFLFARPDSSSVATSYCLLKSLFSEGIFARVRLVFGFVESPEHAASLKTRFDLITGRFLGFEVGDGGFVYRQDPAPADDFSLIDVDEAPHSSLMNIDLEGVVGLQSETPLRIAGAAFPKSGPERR